MLGGLRLCASDSSRGDLFGVPLRAKDPADSAQRLRLAGGKARDDRKEGGGTPTNREEQREKQ